MKTFFKVFLILMLVQFWQCSYAQKSVKLQKGKEKPEWVDNPYAFYSERQYLVGVGNGDTRDAAEKNAIGQIAKIFKTNIQVDEVLVESVFESFKKNKGTIESESSVKTQTRLQSNIELKNVKIEQVYFSEKEGIYYVLAVLDRAETAALLEQDFNENDQLLKKYFDISQTAANKLHRLSNINKALALAQVNKLINEQYKVLTGGQGLTSVVDENELLNAAKKIKEQIIVQIKGSGTSSDEVAAYLREIIGRFGFTMGDQQADLVVDFNLELNKTNLNRPGIVAYNWHLKIDVFDQNNNVTLNTLNLNKRTAAISEDEVRARILRTIKSELNNSFYKQLMDYFNSF